MRTIESAVRIIIYLRSYSKEKSNKSWRSWRELVVGIYASKHSSSDVGNVINQSTAKSERFDSDSEVASFINVLEDQKQGVVSLIQAYLDIEKREGDYLALKENQARLNNIIGEVPDIDKLRTSARIQSQEWMEMALDKRFYTEVFIPATMKIITLDYVLRWGMLGIYNLGGGVEDTWDIEIEGYFFVTNLIVIPIIVCLYAYYRDKWVRKKTAEVLNELNIPNLKLTIKNTAWNYSLLAFYVFSGAVIFNLVDLKLGIPGTITLMFSITHAIYLFILLRIYSTLVPGIVKVEEQLELKKHRELDIELGVDENDEEIVNLDVNLRSANDRMNSFVLEAALLGALAFSCFLQIIATGEFTIASIQVFSAGIVELLSSIINFKIQGTFDILVLLGSKQGLLALMCYESLLCSAFFLAVIASRLQFSSLTDFVDRSINLARSYNSKEEGLVYGHGVSLSDSRVVDYNKRIRSELKTGYRKQGEIEPIMEFMSFFRTLGVTSFFIIVITGGLFVSAQLSMILLLISLLSAFYFKLDAVIAAVAGLKLGLEEFSYRFNRHLAWSAWLLIGSAVVLRSLGFGVGGLVLLIGYIVLIVQHLLLLFIPNPDQLQNEIGSNVEGLSNRMRVYFILIFVLLVVSVIFKQFHLAGSGPAVVLALSLLSAFFFSSPKLKDGPKWMGRVLSIGLGLMLLFFIFQIQHWPYSSMIFVFAVVPMIVGVYILFSKWKLLSRLNRAAIIFCSFILLSDFSPFLRYSFATMKFDYTEYLERNTMSFLAHDVQKWVESENDGYPDSVIHYMNLLEAELHNNPDPGSYNRIAWTIYELRTDSAVLAKGLEWSIKAVELDSSWMFIDTKGALLYKLGRYEEAERVMLRAVELGAGEETEILLKDIQKQLN